MARTYGKFSDLITFTRASGGTALRPVSYGSELVTNGAFDSDSGWLKSGDVTISGGAANIVSTGTYQYVAQTNVLEVGKIYQVTYDIVSPSTGSLKASTSFDGVANIPSTVGSHSFVGKAKLTTLYIERDTICNVLIDNISVREVLFDQPNAPLTLFNHPVDIPRIEYDADGNRLGLLIEEARTNRVPASNDWGNGTYWSTIRATFTANQAVSPDGSVNAAALTEDTTASSTHLGLSSSNITVVDAAIYTSSIFVKANTRSWVQLQEGQGVTASAYFNLATGEIGTVSGTGSPSASIQDVGNGWYRCSLTFTSLGTAARIRLYLATGSGGATYTGDGTSGVFLWGAQLEEGAFPTSYIPTSGSTATRAADSASIPVSEFGYNDDEGTFFVEFDHTDPGGITARNYMLSTSASARFLYNNAGNDSWFNYDGSGSTSFGLMAANGTLVKFAVGMDENGSAGSQDGEAILSGVTTPQNNVLKTDNLYMGEKYSGGDSLNGHIKSIKYYPRRLTNAQLQELTS